MFQRIIDLSQPTLVYQVHGILVVSKYHYILPVAEIDNYFVKYVFRIVYLVNFHTIDPDIVKI